MSDTFYINDTAFLDTYSSEDDLFKRITEKRNSFKTDCEYYITQNLLPSLQINLSNDAKINKELQDKIEILTQTAYKNENVVNNSNSDSVKISYFVNSLTNNINNDTQLTSIDDFTKTNIISKAEIKFIRYIIILESFLVN